ncbi:hypothetical protein V8E55_003313 [Tylopilus felleus]
MDIIPGNASKWLLTDYFEIRPFANEVSLLMRDKFDQWTHSESLTVTNVGYMPSSLPWYTILLSYVLYIEHSCLLPGSAVINPASPSILMCRTTLLLISATANLAGTLAMLRDVTASQLVQSYEGSLVSLEKFPSGTDGASHIPGVFQLHWSFDAFTGRNDSIRTAPRWRVTRTDGTNSPMRETNILYDYCYFLVNRGSEEQSTPQVIALVPSRQRIYNAQSRYLHDGVFMMEFLEGVNSSVQLQVSGETRGWWERCGRWRALGWFEVVGPGQTEGWDMHVTIKFKLRVYVLWMDRSADASAPLAIPKRHELGSQGKMEHRPEFENKYSGSSIEQAASFYVCQWKLIEKHGIEKRLNKA